MHALLSDLAQVNFIRPTTLDAHLQLPARQSP